MLLAPKPGTNQLRLVVQILPHHHVLDQLQCGGHLERSAIHMQHRLRQIVQRQLIEIVAHLAVLLQRHPVHLEQIVQRAHVLLDQLPLVQAVQHVELVAGADAEQLAAEPALGEVAVLRKHFDEAAGRRAGAVNVLPQCGLQLQVGTAVGVDLGDALLGGGRGRAAVVQGAGGEQQQRRQ